MRRRAPRFKNSLPPDFIERVYEAVLNCPQQAIQVNDIFCWLRNHHPSWFYALLRSLNGNAHERDRCVRHAIYRRLQHFCERGILRRRHKERNDVYHRV